MAQGSTDTWAASCDEICSDALANLGAIGPGEAATGEIRAFAKRHLEDLVKSIDADGQFLWRISRLTTTTVASQATVSISALAVDIDEPVRYTKSGATQATILRPMTRDEYMAIPDRTVTADRPTSYFVEKALTNGRVLLSMYLWPEPEDASDTVEYAAFLRAKDFTTGAINPDFPSSWNACLKAGVTMLIAPAFKQAGLVRQYRDFFLAEKEKLLQSDNEKQGLTLVAFGGAW